MSAICIVTYIGFETKLLGLFTTGYDFIIHIGET